MRDLYFDVLEDLLRGGHLRREMRILVLCGGARDYQALLQSGFTNVTISNLDSRERGEEFAPFQWSFQDAEKVTFEDESFDFCVAADGLHHCQSPHRGLLELYRVARHGLVVLEPRDNLLTRVGVWLGFGQEYEDYAVHANAGEAGGVRNTEVPNFVYRWTEREIQKTINSYAPWGKHKILFWYKLRVQWNKLRTERNKARLLLTALGFPLLRLFTWLFPGQSNNFAFAVIKPRVPDDLQPWIVHGENGMRLNREWIQKRYGALRNK